MRIKATKKTGRPACVHPEQILDAAVKLFAEQGFEGTSTREIAAAAKCNSAMIAYHFGNKDGLYQAVLERFAKSVQEPFAEVVTEPMLRKKWPELKSVEEREVCNSLFGAARAIVLNELMHKIFSREMMREDCRIVKLYAKNGGAVAPLRELLAKLQKSGKVRKDFDWRFAVISLLAPVVYSKIAKPMLREVYGFKQIDEKYVRELCVYLTRAFFEGNRA